MQFNQLMDDGIKSYTRKITSYNRMNFPPNHELIGNLKFDLD